jgi:hypothetical protein
MFVERKKEKMPTDVLLMSMAGVLILLYLIIKYKIIEREKEHQNL